MPIRAALLLVALAAACGPKERRIAGPLTLGPAWVELKPDPPLEASRQAQHVSLETAAVLALNPPAFEVKAADGTPVKVEIEVVDDRGEVFPHRFAQYGGRRLDYAVVAEKLPKEDPLPYYLSPDRRYTLVRLRSNPPVAVEAVYWVCSSFK